MVLIAGAAGVGTSRLAAATLGEAPLAARPARGARPRRRQARGARRCALLRRRVGIVPQDLCLLEDRSAQLNVVLPLEIDGVPRSISIVRAAEILTLLELESEAPLPVDCLPASVRQRVAVARALVRDPDIVIADHPTSAQDAMGADLVCTAIQAAAVRGAACLVLGRDPALRRIADLYGWRQLALVGGTLRPLAELELAGRTLDEALAGIEPAPIEVPAAAAADAGAFDDEELTNIVPFPFGGPRGRRGGVVSGRGTARP